MKLDSNTIIQGLIMLALGAILTRGCALYDMVLQHESRIGFIEPLVVDIPYRDHEHIN